MKKNDKARVRVFFGEIEGDDATIRDGLRSIAEAVNRTFQPDTRIVKVITAGGNADPNLLAAEAEQEVIEADFAAVEAADSADSVSNGQKSKASRARKAPSYSLVKDLDLRPEGKPSLVQFYQEKKPGEQQQQLTVVLYYLYRTLEIESVSVNHVYTSLKELSSLGVRVPTDIAQVFRQIANRKGWVDSSDAKALKTTVGGDNFVEHDLPSKGGVSQEQGEKK